MRARLLRVAAVAAAAVGCRPGAATGGVDDSTFVATMAELRRIQSDVTLDEARRAAARDSVLQRRGLTPQDLVRAAQAMAADEQRATRVWQSIDRRARGDTLLRR